MLEYFEVKYHNTFNLLWNGKKERKGMEENEGKGKEGEGRGGKREKKRRGEWEWETKERLSPKSNGQKCSKEDDKLDPRSMLQARGWSKESPNALDIPLLKEA